MRRFALIITVLMMSLTTMAQEIVVDGIRYYGDYKGHATIAAFQSKNLEGTIVIPSSVSYQGETLTVNKFEEYAFAECTKIRSVVIPPSVDETLYDCGYEFYGCTSLEEITLSPNMQMLKGTFMGCKALKKIVIPEGVKYMDYVFENCSALEDVSLPEGVIEIGFECFYGCTSLKSISIPSSVSSIGLDAFAYCRGVENVTCLATIPPSCLGKAGPRWVTVNPFNNIAPNAVLYVPSEALESYKDTYPWNTFCKIEAINTNGIMEIEAEPQYNNVWDLSGQRVQTARRGIFIHNGKKYLKR